MKIDQRLQKDTRSGYVNFSVTFWLFNMTICSIYSRWNRFLCLLPNSFSRYLGGLGISNQIYLIWKTYKKSRNYSKSYPKSKVSTKIYSCYIHFSTLVSNKPRFLMTSSMMSSWHYQHNGKTPFKPIRISRTTAKI